MSANTIEKKYKEETNSTMNSMCQSLNTSFLYWMIEWANWTIEVGKLNYRSGQTEL